jgi:hypothetical protein
MNSNTRSGITMTFSLLVCIIIGVVIFISSLGNDKSNNIIYAQFQNNVSNISLGINITSPQRNQQIPIGAGDLTISGKSTDNSTVDDCQVSVIVNGIKPYQPATANGSTGAKSDYSKWLFILGSNYTSIKEGTNEITSKLSCLSNGLSNNNNATKWYSINVTGVTAPSNNITVSTQPSSVTNSSAQDEPNIDQSQNLEKDQEKPASEKKAEKTMKEEIKTLRERIMDEVERGLKEQGIELNLPD